MPTSRNRKKKKKSATNQNSESAIKSPINRIVKQGIAPQPITMNYYEVETNGLSGMSFEERLATVRNMGAKAAIDFPEKYNALQEWFHRFDQLYILGFTFYYFMTAPAGYDEEAVTGGLEFPPHYQELLQAFALTVHRNFDPHPFAHEVEKFKKDFAEIGELIKLRHFNIPDQIKTPEALATHQIRIEMMMHTIAVRNWSYEHKMSEVTLALAVGVRDSFLQVHGFDPEVFLKALYNMTEKIQERLNAHKGQAGQYYHYYHCGLACKWRIKAEGVNLAVDKETKKVTIREEYDSFYRECISKGFRRHSNNGEYSQNKLLIKSKH